jgi:hypothetical protein
VQYEWWYQLTQRTVDPDLTIDCRRPVVVDPRDPKCFELIRSWLRDCAQHANCSQSAPVRLPKRIIDIPSDLSEDPKLLVTADHHIGEYVILSHCWGRSGIPKLTDSLLPQFQDAIPSDLLPKSFVDAIEITRRLGFRYLWIDALCISQDNAADWAEEAPKMALYYGRSALMIAATAAEDSSIGILTNRHVPYSPIMGREKKYCLRQKLLSKKWDIERSVMASRGWCAQERMLAPQVIHYTRRQMIWECADGFRFEASGVPYVDISKQADLAYSKPKFQPFVKQAFKTISDASSHKHHAIEPDFSITTSQEQIARIWAWQQCVDEFNKRDLTVTLDKLHAISGVAAVINSGGQMGEYLAGLWSKHIAVGFTWCRAWALLKTPPTYRAPSWSWASVDGMSTSSVLFSSPKLLEPPSTDIGREWASKFDLRLIEHSMVLQNPANVYGPVLEGSYIIVEGTCTTKEQLALLCTNTVGARLTIVFDKSNAADCPCCGAQESETGSSSDSGTEDVPAIEGSCDVSFANDISSADGDLIDDEDIADDKSESSQHLPKMSQKAQFDVAMYLTADAWYDLDGFVDLLLLSWVDEEKKVAKRTGYAKISTWRAWQEEEDLQEFNDAFCNTEWERLRIKLI